MKATNKKILDRLIELNLIETKNKKDASDADIIFEHSNGYKYRISPETMSDKNLHFLVLVEQLYTLKSIKSMVKFHTILTIIGLFSAFILFLIMMN